MANRNGTNLLNNNFKVLPVKFRGDSVALQYMYYKIHRVREENIDRPSGRTLFIINVPPYCTQECFKRLFSDCGTVERVTFQKTTNSEQQREGSSLIFNQKPIQGYKVGYIIFSKAEDCLAAMNITDTTPRILSTDPPLAVGVKKWCEEYNKSIPNPTVIKNEIDEFMKNYDETFKLKVEKEKELDGVPDEEGWITVTRHGKKPVTPRTEAQQIKVSRKEKKKRAQKELLNFYSFQIKESKMDHIVQLRKKFEEDKQRISVLKAARRFKPY